MDVKGYITIFKKTGEEVKHSLRQNDVCTIGSGLDCQIRIMERTVDKKVCVIKTDKNKVNFIVENLMR